MLINVKMLTIVGILTFMSRINFVLMEKFYNLGARSGSKLFGQQKLPLASKELN